MTAKTVNTPRHIDSITFLRLRSSPVDAAIARMTEAPFYDMDPPRDSPGRHLTATGCQRW